MVILNEDAINTLDISDPIDINIIVNDIESVSMDEEELSEEEIDEMLDELEEEYDGEDDLLGQPENFLDIDVDEEIESEIDMTDSDGELIDFIAGNYMI